MYIKQCQMEKNVTNVEQNIEYLKTKYSQKFNFNFIFVNRKLKSRCTNAALPIGLYRLQNFLFDISLKKYRRF